MEASFSAVELAGAAIVSGLMSAVVVWIIQAIRWSEDIDDRMREWADKVAREADRRDAARKDIRELKEKVGKAQEILDEIRGPKVDWSVTYAP